MKLALKLIAYFFFSYSDNLVGKKCSFELAFSAKDRINLLAKIRIVSLDI